MMLELWILLFGVVAGASFATAAWYIAWWRKDKLLEFSERRFERLVATLKEDVRTMAGGQ